MSSWHGSSRDISESTFWRFDEIPSFAGSGGPLRQKPPWDLTLTCRTLTSYWAHSLVRSWRSRSHDGSTSSGGFIWSDPCLSSQTEQHHPGRRRRSAQSRGLHPKPGTHLASVARLRSAWFGLESHQCPLLLRPGSADEGGGGMRAGRRREEVGGHSGRRGGGRRSAAGRWEEEEGAVAWTSPPPAAYAIAYSPHWGRLTGERKRHMHRGRQREEEHFWEKTFTRDRETKGGRAISVKFQGSFNITLI